MKKSTSTRLALASTVLAAALAATAGQAVSAQKRPTEKCYGVAKAGENDCASTAGDGHSCSGMAKVAYDGEEYKDVPKGTCEKMNGSLTPFKGSNPKIKS